MIGNRSYWKGVLEWGLDTDWAVRPVLYLSLDSRRSGLRPSQLARGRSPETDVLEDVDLEGNS